MRENMLKKLQLLFLGDGMPSFETLAQVEALPAEEKLKLVKSALYSEDHLFKVLFRIALIVDPDNTESSLEWLTARLSSSSTPS